MREGLYLLGLTRPSNIQKKWFESDEGESRLRQDRQIIKQDFPDLKYALHYPTEKVMLYGQIVLVEENSGIPTPIPVKILLPDNYPVGEPVATDHTNKFEHIADRHFYKNGICCLWFPLESEWRGNNPTALLDFLNQVAIFFERQLIYQEVGFWVWGERAHDTTGFLEMLEETLVCDPEKIPIFMPLIAGKIQLHGYEKCPCGGLLKYRICHRPRVNKIRDMIKRFNQRSANA